MKPFAAPLTLVALTSILPELLSGNTPLEALLGFPLLLFLFAYGLPVLLIRELAVRRDTGHFGLFLMGLGYGLINEGLYARTIFRDVDVPVDVFDHYGFALGINWPWTAFICVWHAMASVWLPIALTERHFAQRTPWFGRWAYCGLGVTTLLSGSAFFLLVGQSATEAELGHVENEPVMLAALWVVILAVWVAGSLQRRRTDSPSDRRALSVLIGLTGAPAFIVCAIPADQRWPLALSFAALILLAALYTLAFRFLRLNAAWFALGWYIQIAALSWTAIAMASPLTVVADLLILGMVFLTIRHPSQGAIQ